MIETKIKGINQFYFPKGEHIPEAINDGEHHWQLKAIPQIMQDYLENAYDIRAIAARTIPDWGFAEWLYVYWYETIDLNRVDKDAAANVKLDLYFEKTVILRYGIACCLLGCTNCWHALIMPEHPFAADPQRLNWDKIIEDEVTLKDCPTCGSKLKLPVVKIIGKAETPELPDDFDNLGD
jgi:hypothetical protein